MSFINACHDFRYGRLVCNARDRYITRSIALYGEYSPGEMEIYRQILRPGDTVVEVGANIGALTVPMAQCVGERGRVICFEPYRLVFQLLAANAAINSLTNVYAYNKGVAEADSKVTIRDITEYPPDENLGGYKLESVPEGYEVDVVALDSLGLESCRMIKLDCEGFETRALQGAQKLIETTSPLIYLEENPGALPLLLQYGYEVYRHRVPLFVPDNWFGNRINVFIEPRLDPDGVVRNKAIWSNNWLCVKPDGKWNVKGLEREPAQDELKAGS